jgi:hypothetical protein
LDDALRYNEASGFDPVAHFSSFLEGEIRQDWADIEEVWRKDGTVVTWEMLSEQFIEYVGVDPLERRDQAYEALFTEALHQQPYHTNSQTSLCELTRTERANRVIEDIYATTCPQPRRTGTLSCYTLSLQSTTASTR